MQKHEIPIYKVCHLITPNDFKETESEQLYSPELTGPLPGAGEGEGEGEAAGGAVPLEQQQPLPRPGFVSQNTLYVFYGDIEFEIIEEDQRSIININELFNSDPRHKIFRNIFSEYELSAIQETRIRVVFLPERIYPDDSIETIKKKFLTYTRTTLRLTYGELYMFCKQAKHLKNTHVNEQLTSNGKMEITPIRIQNFLLNIDNHPVEVVNYGGADLTEDEVRQFTDFTKLGEPSPESGNYNYSNILNLKLEDEPRFLNVVIGQELSAVSRDYPYAVNPFDALYMDPFLETHIGEIINTTNKIVLLDIGAFLHNTIYLTTASDVLKYTISLSDPAVRDELGIASFDNARVMTEKYVIQLYFPYLAVFRDETRHSLTELSASEGDADVTTIHSLETLNLHREKIYEADDKIMNDKFMRQTSNVKLLYDIYERRDRTKEHQYIDDGLRGIEFIIHPETKYNISLDALFKKIHCNKDIPFIKLNPGKRLDNIYKLFTPGTSKSGRKIPKMQKSDIFRLMRTCALKKGLAIYINYIYLNKLDPEDKANHLSIPVICEIHADGCILVKTFFKYSFRVDQVKDIIIATINPVLEVMKEYIEQSGYEMKLFKNFNEENIDIVNIEYLSQIAITKNIEIKTMIKCISSVFNEIEGSLKKGIILRYKRVSNYNEMTSQDAYIVEMLNKRHTDREIIDGLQANYMIEEQDARMKIARLLQSIELQQLSRYRGGTIRIKNNPGFLTKITKGQFNNIISIEISNINNIKFLQLLQMYMDSIIRIYQNPSSTAVPYYEIEKLCRGVVTKPVAASASAASHPRQSENLLESGFSSSAASASDIQSSEEGGELGAFVNVSQNKAVTKEINREDKEADVGGVADITASSRKPFPESVSAAIIGEKLVFGFEAEQQQAAVGEAADDYEAFFGLIGDEEDEGASEGEGEGGVTEFSKGGAKARGRPKSKKQGSEHERESDSGSESETEDMSDITGMELSNPNPFSKRIQERDPDIHLNEDSGKFNAYSRSCPGHYGRQPVILTDEEKAQIDKEHPGSYSQSIRYGSDPKNQYNYICPRYWSLKHNTSLTEEEVKSGKYGKIIPHKSKKIPSGTNIFEFTDDKYHIDEQGNYKQHYPGFLKKDVHPKGLCVPCCFSQWDKPSQTQRRQECEIKQHEEVTVKQTQKRKKAAVAAVVAAAAGQGEEAGAGAGASAASSGSPPVVAGVQAEGVEEPAPEPAPEPASEVLKVQPIPNHSEVVKIREMKDDRILSSDKFPLDNNRWGYLPVQIQKFLFTDNRNCQVSLKNTAIKKDTPCLLRRGVEAHDKQSFVSVIAYYYMEQNGKTKTSIRTDSRSDIEANKGRETQSRPQNAMADNIRDIIEENTTPGKIDKSKLMSMFEKTVTKDIASLSLKQPASSGMGGVAAASPVSREEAGSAPAAESEENPNYESKNETPISMTPRAMNATTPSASAAFASSSSGSGTRVNVFSDVVPTIRDMRNIIKESLDIDSFITLQNGTLVDVFYNSKQEIQERDTMKYRTSEIYKKLRASAGAAEDTDVLFNKICNAFENFIGYLDRDDITIDHTYLWDIVSQPNPKLFNKGNNIILLHIPDDDITNNVQVICPTNSYSGEVFDPNKKTIIIMKRDTYYEPIYSFESKSNGKFDALGRFAIKSNTIMPRIKHIIETIRDLYFSYCRLHSSRPRQYKYVMNMPAKQIAKLVKNSGFQIMSQVMNYNGKIIGLRIRQTITITKFKTNQRVKASTMSKVFSGVIPTAASAPIVRSKMDATAAATSAEDKETYEYPIAMMDDDQIWENTYRDEVEFLNQVADHVKKMTKQTIYCRPKVKVVEEGIIIGIITETNQFVQVRIDEVDPQLNQDDGIPTVTEGNQLMAEKEISTVKPGTVDKAREKYVRNVRLETNFYNVFRNTARIILNKPENKATKDEIERIINSPFMVYSNKLSRIVELLKGLITKHVGFIAYSNDVLKNIGEISGCIYKDDAECSKKKYCMKENGGLCKLLLPERNLMYPSIDNSIAYYGKLTDEIIRYERVKLFIFEPTKYLTFQETKYDLWDTEIILLESLITQEYFENLVPVDPNPFAINTHFYTINPNRDDSAMVQIYDNMYRKGYVDRYKELNDVRTTEKGRELPPGAGASASASASASAAATAAGLVKSGIELFHSSEIDHVLSFCSQVSKRKVTASMQRMFFPKNCYELLFSNESEECSFDVILTILRSVAQNASKCPCGHTCNRLKRPIKGIRPAETISASLEASAASAAAGVEGVAAAVEDESAECRKCRLSIGAGDTGFACVHCNYFVCENCQYQHVDRMSEMNITKLKEILVEEYDKLSKIPTFDKKLTTILNGYGMKKYANLIIEGKATFAAVIQSANYFLTNVDIWILARYFKLPIIFVSQSLLIENGKNILVLYGNASIETYFFIHPFGVTQDTISRFSMIGLKITEDTSVFKIPLSAVTLNLRETIAREIDADEPSTLERFITTFKISNIKNKPKPLFVTTVTEPGSSVASAGEGKGEAGEAGEEAAKL